MNHISEIPSYQSGIAIIFVTLYKKAVFFRIITRYFSFYKLQWCEIFNIA